MATSSALRVSGLSVVQPKIRRMPLARFRQWRSNDGWKYDWNDGEISKYKKMVTEEQRYIVQNLMDAFYEKGLNKQGGLMPESEMAYDDRHYRIPDLAYYTRAQTKILATREFFTVSSFVIEILFSDKDLAKDIENKLWEYFKNGVQVVWHIIPYRKIVKVYTSPQHVKICLADDVCSAKPALPDFEMTVHQIFELAD